MFFIRFSSSEFINIALYENTLNFYISCNWVYYTKILWVIISEGCDYVYGYRMSHKFVIEICWWLVNIMMRLAMGRIDQQSICGYYDDGLILLIYYHEKCGIFLYHIIVIMSWLFRFMILVGEGFVRTI